MGEMVRFAASNTDNTGGEVVIAVDSNLNQNSIDQSKKVNQKCYQLKRRCEQVLCMRYHLIIIIIFSFIGFGWHLSDALSEYWAYKTRVTFAAEEPQDYKYGYPGVTVCHKDLAPFYKLKERYPEFGEDVDRITIEAKIRNKTNFFADKESQNLTSVRKMGNQLQDHYENKLINDSTIIDILENWSFGEPDRCQLHSLPIVREKIENCTQVSSVLQSINADVRCFTYFSQLFKANKSDDLFTTSIFESSNNYEDRQNAVAYIGFSKSENSLNPFETGLRYRIAIHPSNMIPDPKNYPNKILYEWWRFYPVAYWKTVSYLLEPPYETNCAHYHIRDPNHLQSYDDCFSKCVIQIYREKCKCLPRSGLLYYKNLLNSDDKFCPFDNKCKTLNIRSSCAKSCKPNCISEQYEFETWADIRWYNFSNSSGVTIYRKPVLDQVYRHSPGITWIQLVSDFGGLGGMWLGISVITISKAIICWLHKFLFNNKIDEGSI